MIYPDILSIARTAVRCKDEGIPLSEKALRRFVKNGTLSAVQTGKKALLYFPNVREFVKKGNTSTIVQKIDQSGKIRQLRL
jgi:hypothetical protein